MPSATSDASTLVQPLFAKPLRPLRQQSVPGEQEGCNPLKPIIFIEFFAGDARLTEAFRAVGIRCRAPDDLVTGGTDFEIASQVRKVREELRALRTDDLCLAIHLAPPCSTFSRARDRSKATCLRSSSQPEGLSSLSPSQKIDVERANRIARHAWELAEWASKELRAVVCLENPRMSYIWDYYATISSSSTQRWKDVLLSQCQFGTTYRKDFGWFQRPLFDIV